MLESHRSPSRISNLPKRLKQVGWYVAEQKLEGEFVFRDGTTSLYHTVDSKFYPLVDEKPPDSTPMYIWEDVPEPEIGEQW